VSANPTIFERFRQFPRAVQWAVIAGLGILLFLVWDETISPMASQWNRKADRIERALSQSRDTDASVQRVRQVSEAILSLGPVELPRGTSEASQSLNQAVDEVLAQFKGRISIADVSIQTPSKLGRNALKDIAGANQVAQRVPVSLRFEAAPEDAIAIIASLESSPVIESITNVSLAKAGDKRGAKKLTAQLTLEAWALGASPATRATGADLGGLGP
jgi:hypothetical protein